MVNLKLSLRSTQRWEWAQIYATRVYVKKSRPNARLLKKIFLSISKFFTQTRFSRIYAQSRPCNVFYSIWGNEVTLFNEKQTNEMSVFLEFLNLIKLRIGNTAITKEFLTILVSFPLTLLAAMLYLYCPCVYCVIIVNMYIDMQIQSKFISFTVNSDAQEQTKQYTHCDLTTPQDLAHCKYK